MALNIDCLQVAAMISYSMSKFKGFFLFQICIHRPSAGWFQNQMNSDTDRWKVKRKLFPDIFFLKPDKLTSRMGPISSSLSLCPRCARAHEHVHAALWFFLHSCIWISHSRLGARLQSYFADATSKGSRGLVLQGISAQSASFKKTPKDVKNKVAVGWQDSFRHASTSDGA